MAHSRDAFNREIRERLGRNQRETRKREERTIDRLQKDQQETRYGAMADGLSQTNKIAREIQRELDGARESKRGDMKPFRQLVYKKNGRTLLVPKVAIATEKISKSIKKH